MLLNVRVDGISHIGELQLHIEKIKAAKPKAHRLYKVLRSQGWEELQGLHGQTAQRPTSLPSPDSDEYERLLQSMQFRLQEDFPKVAISYCTASAYGRGEFWMWTRN
jgi:hypothetical protein